MSAQSTASPLSGVGGLERASGDQDAVRARAHARRRLLVFALRIGLGVFILASWEALTSLRCEGKDTATCVIDPFFFGKPSGIWAQLVTWARNGTAQGPLWEQIVVTLEETVLGFLIGVALGIVFGVVLGRSRMLSDVLGPYIKALNAMPRVVLGSIFTIALGLEMPSKVALAVVLVFFVVFFNAFQGVREVDRDLVANARILGADERRLFTDVVLPSALSWIIASLHTSLGFALVGAIVGEYLGARQGIGLMIATAQGSFNSNGVYAAMLILAVIAILAEALVTRLESVLIRWRPNAITDVTI
ncbi:MAG: ABC transporter permease [Chloroflexota bacterium]|nr:ABC transporter permease [Chloroflexota bacterium]MDE3192372.1 ABC transporter permease [Chloroflexota bacterium]